MNNPKIAIYAICKNEEKFAKRFAETCKDADEIIVVDTGSTDNTVKILKENGVAVPGTVSLMPFRFDQAREIALSFVPQDVDICISLDLDEILQSNWREVIEREWKTGFDRLYYNFVWSWVPGKEGEERAVEYTHSKVHARHKYKWVDPCHEMLVQKVSGLENSRYCKDFEIFHYPDNTKSRGSYLSILEVGVIEEPSNARRRYYYARELFFVGQYTEAIKEFDKYIKLLMSNDKYESEAVYCSLANLYMARCYKQLGILSKAKVFCQRAIISSEDKWREPYIVLSEIYLSENKFDLGLFMAEAAMRIPNVAREYYSDIRNLEIAPYDLGAVCAWYSGDKEKGKRYIEHAYLLDGGVDQRIADNHQFILNVSS